MASSEKSPMFFCQNPFCHKFHNKPFASQAAYTNHVDRSPSCFNFIVNQAHVAAPHGAVVGRRPHEPHNPANVGSTKRPALLRRHMVNDCVPTSTSDVPVVRLAQFPNVHFNPSDGLMGYESGFGSESGDEGSEVDEDSEGEILLHDKSDDNDESPCADFDDEDDHVWWNSITNPVMNEKPSFRSNFTYTTDQKCTVSLLKILDDANAPDYVFGEVLKWSRSAVLDNYSFKPRGGLSRSKNVDVVMNSVRNAKQMLPFVRRVLIPHGSPSDVICFDFAAHLLSLLQNRSIMTASNLAIDINDPLKPYTSDVLGEAISGSVYRKAYERMITDTSTQFFVPIIQWIDRTHVTGSARFSLKPYMFTLAIFKEKFRRSIDAWRYHGFLPKKKCSSAMNSVLRQGDAIRNYHAELHGALQSFRECSQRLRGVWLPIGPTGSMRVDIVTCLLFVIQDMQEGDMLCGRYGVHSAGVERHSRACNVNFANLDNSMVECQYLEASDMDKIARSKKATRKLWSQHQVDNAFNHVRFADPKRGIFGATPIETMHAFRKGVIENVTFLVLDNVPASKKAAFDNLAIAFHKSHRQTFRKEYPATDFSNGVTNLTKISASERLGLVFLFVILFQFDEGWRIIQKCLENGTTSKVPEVLQVLESLLCFDAWLNKTSYWETSDPRKADIAMAKAKDSIRRFMDMCKESIPIKNENKWKFPKFHELLHAVDDMSRFGSSMNFCAQRPESLLIPAAKQPGRRAQKRHVGSAYELQAAQRLIQSLMIKTVHTRMCEYDANEDAPPILPITMSDSSSRDPIKTKPILQGTGHATFGTITRVRCGEHTTKWGTRTHTDFMRLPPALLDFVCDKYEELESIRLCTEYQRADHTYRCHPSYQSDGGIYDWMVMNLSGRKGGRQQPCRLALVIILDSPEILPEEKYQLVVQATTGKTGGGSCLFNEWSWSPTYILVSSNKVVRPCFVVSITHNGSTVLETIPYEEWAYQFT